MSEWNYLSVSNPPENTKSCIGLESLKWYDVMYNDGIVGKACWWYNHWYQNSRWYEIIAWKEEENEKLV